MTWSAVKFHYAGDRSYEDLGYQLIPRMTEQIVRFTILIVVPSLKFESSVSSICLLVGACQTLGYEVSFWGFLIDEV